MRGMNASTGRSLSGMNHLRQSITDILTTPIGLRVMRRDYGSDLPELLDAPVNADTIGQMVAATAEALSIWEPRINVTRVLVSHNEKGSVVIDIDGDYLPDGKPITLKGVKI